MTFDPLRHPTANRRLMYYKRIAMTIAVITATLPMFYPTGVEAKQITPEGQVPV